jgi:fructose-1,6-bisphosphatase I
VNQEEEVGTSNRDGDPQKKLDLLAHHVFIEALRHGSVAAVLSEESPRAIALDPTGSFAVAIDPLDGSSNINSNVSIGTIFGIYPALANAQEPEEHFTRLGQEQIAAGFVIYGPQTSIVFSSGCGSHVFTFDRRIETFRLAVPRLVIPTDSNEYAVNASNYRHWDDAVRTYIDDCLQGTNGPLCRDHNMRWIASLVADAYRILIRGGVFLYPADQRRGYNNGRLRLIYEASPIAFVVEQAGGSATNTLRRILEIRPQGLHARTPIVFGSPAVVQRIDRYHTDPHFSAERNPLFFSRGLIRR